MRKIAPRLRTEPKGTAPTMIRYQCDACRDTLARDGSNHFIIKIEAYAAAGRLEITAADAERDHKSEIECLIRKLAVQTPDEIENQVYRALRYDLCTTCHRRYLDAPLGALNQRDPDLTA